MRGNRTAHKILLSALFAVVVTGVCSRSEGSLFGPGQLGLAASGAISGNPDTALDSSTEEYAVGFTALTSGSLSSFSFASANSTGIANNDNSYLTVAIYSSVNGKPGQLLATGVSVFNSAGGRARSATFTDLNVTAGTNYFAVVSSSKASTSASFNVNAYGLSGSAPRLNGPDMYQVNSGYSFLHSTDSGGTWAAYSNAVGVHSVTIGSATQGFGYTGTVDNAKIYKTTGGQTQYMDQTFTFQTYDAAKPTGTLNNVQIGLRAQGAYASATANVVFRIANAADLSVVGEKTIAVTFGSASVFTNISADFTGTTLISGQNYVLFIGLVDALGTTSDFVFARSYNWGLGDPNLNTVTFGGTDSVAYVASDMNSIGTTINSTRADLPFMIDYTATAVPEPASAAALTVGGIVSLLYRRKHSFLR